MNLALELVPLALLLLALILGVVMVRRVSSGRGPGGVGAILGSKKRSEAGKLDSAIRLAKLFEEAEALRAAAGLAGPPLQGMPLDTGEPAAAAQPSAEQPAAPEPDSIEDVEVPPPSAPEAAEMNGEHPVPQSEDHQE